MRRRGAPFILSTVDVLDCMGERQSNQLQAIHVKDFASHESHLDKSVTGNGEIFFFGNITLNDMDKEEYLSQKFPEYFNNILFPGLYRRK